LYRVKRVAGGVGGAVLYLYYNFSAAHGGVHYNAPPWAGLYRGRWPYGVAGTTCWPMKLRLASKS
jgi:hypothetical protein